MSFVQIEFLVFLPVVFTIYWALRERVWQNRFLAFASFLFYGWVHPWMVGLLLGVSLLNWGAALLIDNGRQMRRQQDPSANEAPQRRDRWILGATVIISIGVLAFFRSFNWFIEAAGARLPDFISLLNVGLPLGLSFYTFHNLAYTIDVYRERVPAQRNVLEYLLFAAYFPQLVAGPVERAGNMFPQFSKPRVLNAALLRSGVTLALWGALKKVAVADTIAPYVDLCFSHTPTTFALVWLGALAFAIQVLADFSGYTDIARGVSRLFGIELMENFEHPYLAATPMEFWQRWHISFSTWLRDYIYLPACFSPFIRRWVTIPFTGEWGAFAHTSRAMFITMVISGIWHGSNWTFILFGVFQAFIIILYTWILKKLPKKLKKQRAWRLLTVPLMFVLTLISMYIFRVPSLGRLIENLALNPFAGSEAEWTVALSLLGVCLLAAAPQLFALVVTRLIVPRIEKTPFFLPAQTLLWAALALGVFCTAESHNDAFIYFQF